MALTSPHEAIYPKSRFKSVKVLYDGTKKPKHEFSIAEIELKDGKKVIGIRHDRNEWNENTKENGYPVVRGGRPSWFIIPNVNEFLPILNKIIKEYHVK